ncbi:phage tail protein [Pectobacterium carotovorum]|uniref:phage tail protein n=1 Tax=Pectobacterium carotovorum TaxID=554 RepID=UPI0039B6ED1E
MVTGKDKITLAGELCPEIIGDDVSLNVLQTMVYTGKVWPLIEDTGNIYGMYVITNINETRSEFFNDDKVWHISFTLSLERV